MENPRIDVFVSSLTDGGLLYLAKAVRDRLDQRIVAEEDRLAAEEDERELAESA